MSDGEFDGPAREAGARKFPVLVVDDEPAILATFRHQFHRSDYDLTLVGNAEEALKRLEEDRFELVITDLRLPGIDGIELLSRVKSLDPTVDVMIMTGYESLDSAIRAVRLDACDYIQKPIEFEYLRLAMDRAIERKRLRSENLYLRSQLDEEGRYGDLLGVSRSVRRVQEIIDRVARTESTVFIQGETGTGKEVVARAIHNLSRRGSGPFVVVNCGAMVETLMESELFGHIPGAFTGAQTMRKGLFRNASGGTIFLDEISEMRPGVQAKLLRTIQERRVLPVGSDVEVEVDVRIIAATNRPIAEAIDKGFLRRDLFYRLNVVSIALPPLRERKEDIPVLIRHFFYRLNADMERRIEGVSSEAMEALVAYDWPGNVRELRNVIERAYTLGDGEVIDLSGLPGELRSLEEPSDRPSLDLGTLERATIIQSLKRSGGDKKKASELLGINRTTLYRKMKRLNIPIEQHIR